MTNAPALSDLNSDRFIRPHVAAELAGVSVATLYRWAASGRIPPPRRLSHRISGWPLVELREFIQRGRTGSACKRNRPQSVALCIAAALERGVEDFNIAQSNVTQACMTAVEADSDGVDLAELPAIVAQANHAKATIQAAVAATIEALDKLVWHSTEEASRRSRSRPERQT